MQAAKAAVMAQQHKSGLETLICATFKPPLSSARGSIRRNADQSDARLAQMRPQGRRRIDGGGSAADGTAGRADAAAAAAAAVDETDPREGGDAGSEG